MGISITQLLIVLAIILLLFGAKKLRSVGADLGSAVKGFRESMDSEEKKKENAELAQEEIILESDDVIIEGNVAQNVDAAEKDKV